MEIYELYGFVNLRIDTQILETNLLQRLFVEVVSRDDIIDAKNCNFCVCRARRDNPYRVHCINV